MKYAWIENEVVRDVCSGDPKLLFTVEIAAHYSANVPDDVMAGAIQVDGAWVNHPRNSDLNMPTDPTVVLSTALQQMADQIDDSVAERCARPQRFIAEYQERETQARIYVNDYGANPAAASSLLVPSRIAAFATAAGLAPYEAARLTVSQADALRDALGQLADLRMRKYEVKRAETIEQARTLCDEILAKIAAVVIP